MERLPYHVAVMQLSRRRNPGRPSDYFPDHVDQASKSCRLAATKSKIADLFEREWRTRHDSISR